MTWRYKDTQNERRNIMDNDMVTDVVEVVEENLDTVKDAAENVKDALPSGAYVGIGAGIGLATAGLGTLAWKKGVKPLIDKVSKKKEEKKDKAAEEDKEESSEEGTTEEDQK